MFNFRPRNHMKYPYTLGAQIVQFPYKYYFKHAWMAKYSLYAILITAPIFYKIEQLSKSPDNVAKWKEIDRKTFSGDHH